MGKCKKEGCAGHANSTGYCPTHRPKKKMQKVKTKKIS